MTIELSTTHRGFALAKFNDFNGEGCSLQQSSIATDDCIWLGVDDAKPMAMSNGRGWMPFYVPPEVQFTTRMHLSREQVAELLPLLTRFAETGSITE